MNKDLKFLQGLASAYEALETKTDNIFYFTTDTKELYIGSKKLTNAQDLADAIVEIEANEDNITSIQNELQTLTGGEESGSISSMIETAVNTAKSALETKMGDLNSLGTDKKDSLVEAINELDNKVDQTYTAEKITIEKAAGEDKVATKYTIKQGGVAIDTTIDIPADMVVIEGKVVTITAEQIGDMGEYNGKVEEPGTYIVLTIANAEKTELYIKVDTLVDIYKAATDEEKTKEIVVKVDNDTREISATIKDGGVSAEKLANNAVTKDKIAESAVTAAAIANEAVTGDKISNDTINFSKLDSELKEKINNTVTNTIVTPEKGTAGIWNDKSGGQLIFLAEDGKRGNVSVNDPSDGSGILVQLSATNQSSNIGPRIILDENKAYYTKEKDNYEFTDDDEIIVKKDLQNYIPSDSLTSDDIVEGNGQDGTFTVKDKEVKVHGLGNLINAGVEQAKNYTDSKFVWENIPTE